MIELLCNADQLSRKFGDLARRDIPIARAKALNVVAVLAQKTIQRELPKHFKIRSTWVERSIFVQKATETQPQATVFVGKLASRFMALQELGGVKDARNGMEAVPLGARFQSGENKGQAPSTGPLMTLKSRWPSKLPNTFVIKTKAGDDLVVQLKGRGKKRKLVTLYILKTSVKIKARWDFRERVVWVAVSHWPQVMDTALRWAMTQSGMRQG